MGTTNTSDQTSDDNMFKMSIYEREIKFSILLTLQVPSISCTVFMLYHFKWHRLHSQIYAFLIIANGLIVVFELPITLLFLYHGSIPSQTYCAPWITVNYSLFVISIGLMAWTSIERYLFIYHERIILRHYILLHYIPICLVFIYSPLYYFSAVVIHQCEAFYDRNRYVCGGACYQYERVLGLIDWVGNVLGTVFITVIVNIIIIIRHLIQKHRMRNVVNQQWRRSLKLTVQLIATSMLYTIGWVPYATIGLIQIFENTDQLAYLLSTIFVYIPYIQTLLLPIICLLFMPDIMEKLRTIIIESYVYRIFHQNNQVDIMAQPTQTRTGRRPLNNK